MAKSALLPRKFEDRSPVDTGVVLGVFQKGNEQDARDALLTAAQSLSHVEPDEVAGPRAPCCARPPTYRQAHLRDRRRAIAGSGQEPHGGPGRRRRRRPTCCYCLRPDGSQRGYIVEMGETRWSATATNIPSCDRMACGSSSAPSTSRWRSPAARRGGAGGRQYRRVETRHRHALGGRLLAECLRDAGLPDGVFNYVTGPGSTLGQALIDDPRVDGITFTGSLRRGYEDLPQLSPRAATRARASSRWAARTRPSSRATPISSAPPSALCARPLACRGRMLGQLARLVEGRSDELV